MLHSSIGLVFLEKNNCISLSQQILQQRIHYCASLNLQSSLCKISYFTEKRKPSIAKILLTILSCTCDCFYSFALNAFLMFLNCVVLTQAEILLVLSVEPCQIVVNLPLLISQRKRHLRVRAREQENRETGQLQQKVLSKEMAVSDVRCNSFLPRKQRLHFHLIRLSFSSFRRTRAVTVSQ